jgi:uncharacterized YigZ family protein
VSYLIPAQTTIAQQHVKDSRFIAYVTHTSTKEDVNNTLQHVMLEFPQASHYCYAFIIGKPNQTTNIGMSDAGEPKGTAGKPIFTVLEHSNVGDIVAIVIRYFGGTLLGTGGLSRAYAGVAQQALQQLPTQLKIDMKSLTVEVPYTLENTVRYLVDEHHGTIINSDYQAVLTFAIELPLITINIFINKLNYQSKHAAKITYT